jgi:SAM-dependent methyltransferase
MNTLRDRYWNNKQAWDSCAEVYERQIVGGHPDIFAYEKFEEDFLDHILRYLAEIQDRPLKLMDIGCGSGRLHIRYGAKTADTCKINKNHPIVGHKKKHADQAYDRLLDENLKEVWGIDFSRKMLELANNKIQNAGLDRIDSVPLKLEEGSAFELQEEPKNVFPIAVCLVNSISVMQGPEGAQELFKSMRRAVEPAGGIAIISCYQKEYIESYGLGQYESTLDVSGQPWWMVPDTFASASYIHIPKSYKRAFSRSKEMIVDVLDRKGNVVEKDFKLIREPKRTAQVIKSGHIRTHTDYESHWYSYGLIEAWVNTYWADKGLHIPTIKLDSLRAEPAQMAVFDAGNSLKAIFDRWDIS